MSAAHAAALYHESHWALLGLDQPIMPIHTK